MDIPHMGARQALLDYDRENDALYEQETAATGELRAKLREAEDRLREKHRAEAEEAFAPFKAQLNAIAKPFEDKREALGVRLEEAIKNDGLEWDDIRWFDDYTDFCRCKSTGLPLLHSDDILADTDGCEFLRAALTFEKPLAAAE